MARGRHASGRLLPMSRLRPACAERGSFRRPAPARVLHSPTGVERDPAFGVAPPPSVDRVRRAAHAFLRLTTTSVQSAGASGTVLSDTAYEGPPRPCGRRAARTRASGRRRNAAMAAGDHLRARARRRARAVSALPHGRLMCSRYSALVTPTAVSTCACSRVKRCFAATASRAALFSASEGVPAGRPRWESMSYHHSGLRHPAATTCPLAPVASAIPLQGATRALRP